MIINWILILSKIQIKIENLDRASGVQDRNRGLDEHFSKKNSKIVLPWLDDGLQGLVGVLEDVLRGLDGVADVDVGVGEVEVEVEVASSARVSKLKSLRVNRTSINLNKIKEKKTRIIRS